LETSISACFTNYNRTDLLFKAIKPFLNDDRIDEIVISDDNSDPEMFYIVVREYFGNEKVKIYRNNHNMDCYKNKREAVKLATNEWVLLLDSDNVFDTKFIDTIFSQQPWNNTWAYAPEWARPHFNFTQISGVGISKNNINTYIDKGSCETMLNAMNYFVNRAEFLRVWDGSCDPVTSDSLFQNYNWLRGGNTVYVTPGLQYEHQVHSGSHYQQNVKRTPHGFHNSIVEKLKKLS
jgi:glycosyltransferase involved in cell wall biosynthesis